MNILLCDIKTVSTISQYAVKNVLYVTDIIIYQDNICIDGYTTDDLEQKERGILQNLISHSKTINDIRIFHAEKMTFQGYKIFRYGIEVDNVSEKDICSKLLG